jgi:putative ABC transport system substrate-binding protein
MAAWPLAARAQQRERLRRIGVLSPFQAPPRVADDTFVRALRDLGWTAGQNVAFEYRYAEGKYDRLPSLAAELVHLPVDVLFTSWGTPTAVAAKNATQTIPVVFTGVGDAIGVGLAASLARPGANVTGLTLISETTIGKQLQLLKEMAPQIAHVAVLTNPNNPVYGPELQDLETMAQTLGVQVERIGVQGQSEFEPAIDSAKAKGTDGLVVTRDAVFVMYQAQLLEAVGRSQLPAIYGLKEEVETGGLMSYGPNLADMYRRAALYIDRILKGTKPGDLPVEQAQLFELVINLKTAKALGLTIPPTLFAFANEIINEQARVHHASRRRGGMAAGGAGAAAKDAANWRAHEPQRGGFGRAGPPHGDPTRPEGTGLDRRS